MALMLRLQKTEKEALARALDGVDGEVYLYGSRTDMEKKGGDIDVLILSETVDTYQLAQEVTVRFRMECDERIDVTVVNPRNISKWQNPFLLSIQRHAVRFHEFE